MRMLTLALCVLRRPVSTFEAMQADRKHFRFWPIGVLLLLFVAVRISYIFLVHYPLASVDPQNASLAGELAYYLVPILTFSVANFGITAVLDGETKMGEALLSVMYCMMPLIILQLPLAALSHVLDQSDAAIFYLIQTVMYGWTALLVITSIRVMNHYTLAKTLLVTVIDILAMALIWAVCLLMYALANQLWMFIEGIIREIRFCFGA